MIPADARVAYMAFFFCAVAVAVHREGHRQYMDILQTYTHQCLNIVVNGRLLKLCWQTLHSQSHPAPVRQTHLWQRR